MYYDNSVCRKNGKIDSINNEIKNNVNRVHLDRTKRIKYDEALETLIASLQNLHICLNPSDVLGNNIVPAIQDLESEIMMLIKKAKENGGDEEFQKKVSCLCYDCYFIPKLSVLSHLKLLK